MKKIGIIGTRSRDTPIARRLIQDELWKYIKEEDGQIIIVSGGCASVLVMLSGLFTNAPMVLAMVFSSIAFIILLCVFMIALVVAD